MGTILTLEQALCPGAADLRISRKLPTPTRAWHAGSISGAGFLDHATRVFSPWANVSTGFSLALTPAGMGALPGLATSINPGLNAYPDPDNTDSVFAWSFWLTSLGTATSDSGFWLRLLHGSTVASHVDFSISSAGFRGNFGGAATATIVAAADVRYGINTVVGAVSDGACEWWVNGVLVATHTSSQAWTPNATVSTNFSAGRSNVSGIEATAHLLQGAAWVGPYNQFAQRLSQGPEALWEPQRIWVPVSAGITAPTLLTASVTNIGSTYATPRVTFTR